MSQSLFGHVLRAWALQRLVFEISRIVSAWCGASSRVCKKTGATLFQKVVQGRGMNKGGSWNMCRTCAFETPPNRDFATPASRQSPLCVCLWELSRVSFQPKTLFGPFRWQFSTWKASWVRSKVPDPFLKVHPFHMFGSFGVSGAYIWRILGVSVGEGSCMSLSSWEVLYLVYLFGGGLGLRVYNLHFVVVAK